MGVAGVKGVLGLFFGAVVVFIIFVVFCLILFNLIICLKFAEGNMKKYEGFAR